MAALMAAARKPEAMPGGVTLLETGPLGLLLDYCACLGARKGCQLMPQPSQTGSLLTSEVYFSCLLRSQLLQTRLANA